MGDRASLCLSELPWLANELVIVGKIGPKAKRL
jgi:hypothetical protein